MSDIHLPVEQVLYELRQYSRTDHPRRFVLWAESIRAALREKDAEIERLREALVRLRDCDWVISLPDRMDAVREIARAALAKEDKPDE